MRFGFRSFAAVAACVAGLAASPAALATPALVGTTTNPTGIDGVLVDGTTYNVTFSTTTLNTFTENTSLSNDAYQALTDALNALLVTGFNATPSSAFVVDVDNSASLFYGAICNVQCTAGSWGTLGASFVNGNLGYYFNDYYYVVAADFAPVPEPITLSLFGAGLAGAVAMRRRKKTAA